MINKETQEMLSSMLTANLQTLNVLTDVKEYLDNRTELQVSDLDDAFARNLAPLTEQLGSYEKRLQTIERGITQLDQKTQATSNDIAKIDEDLSVAITGITALIDLQKNVDVDKIINDYESEHVKALVNALVTTQDNVKKIAVVMQAINNEMKNVKNEMTNLTDSYVDTSSRLKSIELKDYPSAAEIPTNIEDTIKSLQKFTK